MHATVRGVPPWLMVQASCSGDNALSARTRSLAYPCRLILAQGGIAFDLREPASKLRGVTDPRLPMVSAVCVC